MSATHPKYRPDIDGLRAIAVLSVIGFHAFPSVVKGGFIGVDIFFVISGFLISSIVFSNLENNSFSFLDFYVRRIKRIFPALVLVLLSCAVFGWFALPPEDYRSLGKHMAAGVAFISNFSLWGEAGYFDAAADSKPLLHLWSLAIEEQFYIVWPLLLGIVWRRKWNFLAVTIAIALASFAANIWTVQTDQVAAFYSPLSRFWELMIGGILAYITLHRPQHLPNWPNLFSVFGLALIAVGLISLSRASPFPGWPALLPTFGAFLLIAAGPRAWINRYLLGNRAMVAVGLISYPLYLWHWPALFVVSNHQLVAPIQPVTLYWGAKLLAILTCFLLSYATYRVMEQPIRRSKSLAVPLALVAALFTLGLVGAALFLTKGMERRFPAQLNELLSFDYRSVEQYRRGTCFVDVATTFKESHLCSSPPPAGSKANIVLWGDSHAAHLYPGLEAVAGKLAGITQLNTGNCPPFIGQNASMSSQCQANNEFVVRAIEKSKPSMVLLSAGWRRYPDWPDVSRTIEALKRLKVGEIVLVGPAPQWNGTLPRQMFEYATSHGSEALPARLPSGFNASISSLDESMAQFAARERVRYISPYKTFCNRDGCLAQLESGSNHLTSFDYDHFTTEASIYLVKQFPPWFFTAIADVGAVPATAEKEVLRK